MAPQMEQVNMAGRRCPPAPSSPRRSSGLYDRQPALLDPMLLVAWHGLGKRNALGRRLSACGGPGGVTSDPSTAPPLRTAPSFSTTFLGRIATGLTATIPAFRTDGRRTTVEEIGIDALREATDCATFLAARACGIPAGPSIVAHTAAPAAACQSLAAVALAGARGVRLAAATVSAAVTGTRQCVANDLMVRITTAVPVPRALPPALGAGGAYILCLEVSEQAREATNSEGPQSLAAGCVVA